MNSTSGSDSVIDSSHDGTWSSADDELLAVFRKFRMGQGEMLCFFGPTLEKHRRALARLTELGMLVKERFRGGYALTPQGFAAMIARGKRRAKLSRAAKRSDRLSAKQACRSK